MCKNANCTIIHILLHIFKFIITHKQNCRLAGSLFSPYKDSFPTLESKDSSNSSPTTTSVSFNHTLNLLLTDFEYIPVFSLHSSLQYLHNILYAQNAYSRIYILNSHVFQNIIRVLFPFTYPIKLELDTDILGGISTYICTWFGHISPSIIFTPFLLQGMLKIFAMSCFNFP